MDKLERLLNLTAALLDTTRPLTAEEIRVRVPGYPEQKVSFRRAFERDKDDLREMGIPVELETIPGSSPPIEGYRVRRERYELADPGLAPDELAALHLAASAVRFAGSSETSGSTAVWKLGGVVEPLGVEAPPVALDADERLVTLFEAIATRQRVGFRYRDVDRQVDPYRLEYRIGHWYLHGRDHVREEERRYRVDRIAGDVTTIDAPGAFDPPRESGDDGSSVEPWSLPTAPPVVARLLVDPDQAPSAVQQVGADRVEEQRADGSVVLRMAVTNPDGFRSFALGFLDHAEVLEPPELRQDLVDWLAELAGHGGR